MKEYVMLAAILITVSGCGGEKTILPLNEAGNMTEEKLEQELAGFSREEIAAAWGEPAQSLFGMDGEIFRLDEDRVLFVYYGSDGQTMETVKFGEISRTFEGGGHKRN